MIYEDLRKRKDPRNGLLGRAGISKTSTGIEIVPSGAASGDSIQFPTCLRK